MRNVLKVLLCIVIWASLGLGPGYVFSKSKNKHIDLGTTLALSAYGPLAGALFLIIFVAENSNTCVLNCGEDL